jgi:hypothetical protein
VKCSDENDFPSERIEPDGNEVPCGTIEQGSGADACHRTDIRDAHKKSIMQGGVTGERATEMCVFPSRLEVEQASVIGEEGESIVICIHYFIAVAIARPGHEPMVDGDVTYAK